MVTFRNNNRRSNFRRNDRSYKANGDRTKFPQTFQVPIIFKEKFLAEITTMHQN